VGARPAVDRLRVSSGAVLAGSTFAAIRACGARLACAGPACPCRSRVACHAGLAPGTSRAAGPSRGPATSPARALAIFRVGTAAPQDDTDGQDRDDDPQRPWCGMGALREGRGRVTTRAPLGSHADVLHAAIPWENRGEEVAHRVLPRNDAGLDASTIR